MNDKSFQQLSDSHEKLWCRGAEPEAGGTMTESRD